MKPKALTPSEEDYVLVLSRLEHPIRTSDVAKAMNVSDSSATTMVAKLGSKGFIYRDPNRPIRLSEIGEEYSRILLRKHRLLELFLSEILGYEWHEVHEEAHRLEHYVSDKFIDTIEKLLDNPHYDPHGAPIPDKLGQVPEVISIRLTDMTPGQTGTICHVQGSNSELLKYLGDFGLFPDVAIKLLSKAPFNGPITVGVNDTNCVLGGEAAHAISVRLDS